MASKVRCFFDIEVDDVPLGRIIFELFNEICPRTSENFRALCTGEKGIGKTTQKPLHFKNVKFHRVIKDFMIQAGDFSSNNGTGGECIYGGQFEDENFELNHDSPFLLSMANRGKNTNGSQFFITTQMASHLDGKHVVFGRVVSGQEVVVAIENLPVDNRSRPLQEAVISSCGELIIHQSGRSKTKNMKKKKKREDNLSDSDDAKRKKRKKEKKEKRRKENFSEEEVEEDIQEVSNLQQNGSRNFRPHPLVSITAINPDEIPEVPRNRFLYRGTLNDGDRPKGEQQQPGRLKSKANVKFYTRSGRKVKGRGSLRYRTPSRSRSRSRSFTPPHWRQAQRRTVSLEKYQRQKDLEEEREREIEERRKKREERHKMMSEGGKEGNREKDEEEGEEVVGMRSLITGEKAKPVDNEGAEDKTSRDWRIARHETSLADKQTPSLFKRQAGKDPNDLRMKLKDKGSADDRGDKRHNRNRDELDLDDTALDYEAPSENEEEEEPAGKEEGVLDEDTKKEVVTRRDRDGRKVTKGQERRKGDRDSARFRGGGSRRSRSRERRDSKRSGDKKDSGRSHRRSKERSGKSSEKKRHNSSSSKNSKD